MTEIVKESVTTQNEGQEQAVTTEIKREASGFQTIEYIIYFFFGLLDILLLFRLLFKLTGASTSSSFVNLIYDSTRIFILPFEGIFNRGVNNIADTTSIFEPSTFVAIIIYAVLAWGIVKLIRIFSGEKQE
ncbi:MAG: hypothetical protein UR34_C0003G0043 [candidate division WS6 bacterium GW2011_GWC1_33_20]|uniref:YGGT family protein n=2 Tax=Candidatus Dojkabacteria TaxID=74243 RepID=A0A0G0AVQ5_9BACT|nr:MAG: hypothetical protein UR32_C0003G0002 [candidate division WS6 bacterium GW2011_GWE2_33_157]KKP44417.1 MAG: hypothetical protein UR34_C0003G0043 [candidate division WS6 bacterium GW2011_GWC1_33_20]KKP46047.1 MAG: hypothetical protein UR36_C0002G0089 [candidate division WS6 bacterium GW2011_GWF1_33_233]KKP55441.1 MAG: hypothetical protein UR47_C0001G0002 [candidate division WS6 bacterium GW2011_GWB1_33_6]KKP55520.1 MAG: hypothetical protein UR45_C0001G0002 [candidate division WS6 bacterium